MEKAGWFGRQESLSVFAHQPRTTGGEGAIDLRQGRYQDVLQDVTCDAVICDPPYSARTHEGRRTGSDIRQANIQYQHIEESDAAEFAAFWNERCMWWAVIFCDHVARRWHADAWEAVGWYVFGPVRWIKPNAPPRMSGDGPTVASEDILIARRSVRLPQERTGSRRGYYEHSTSSSGSGNEKGVGQSFPGQKPLALMSAIIRDYSRPGDLICDPCAGGGTTLIAAASQGRKAIGAEMDPVTHAKAMRRIEAGYTPDWIEIVA